MNSIRFTTFLILIFSMIGCETMDIENSYSSNTKEISKEYDKNEYGYEEINLKMKLIPGDLSNYGTVYFNIGIELKPDNIDDDYEQTNEEYWSEWDEQYGFLNLELFDKDGFKIETIKLHRGDITLNTDSEKLEILSENTFFEIRKFKSISDFDIIPMVYIED